MLLPGQISDLHCDRMQTLPTQSRRLQNPCKPRAIATASHPEPRQRLRHWPCLSCHRRTTSADFYPGFVHIFQQSSKSHSSCIVLLTLLAAKSVDPRLARYGSIGCELSIHSIECSLVAFRPVGSAIRHCLIKSN